MQEEDTCRICSFPGDSDQPLFHPCKCSGTIRYIHQDCLTTWLAHSKKKTCDVCKYQYTFTKVYSPNMPKHIPFILFIRRFAHQLLWACLFGLRGVMVAVIWLAFLPYVTVWTWRFYFIMGENIAWWINDRPRPAPSSVFSSYYAHSNSTDLDGNDALNSTTLNPVVIYPILKALSSDIFTGQIIASLIVFAFLGVFLLREWIIQNARPGVFEDNAIEHVQEDVDGGGDQEVAPNDDPQREAHEAQGDPVEEGLVQNVDADEARNSSDSNFSLLELEENAEVGNGFANDPSDSEESRHEENDLQTSDAAGRPPRRRRLLHENSHPRHERPLSRENRSQSWNRQSRNNRRIFSSSRSSESISPEGSGVLHTADLPANNSSPASENFQFTFTVDRPAQHLPEATPTSSEPIFSFRPLDIQGTSWSVSESQSFGDEFEDAMSEDFDRYPSSSRRPPLHNSTLPRDQNAFGYGYWSSEGIEQQGSPPFPSPGIASYRAPEEFGSEAGPSHPPTSGYVDRETASSASTAGMEEEEADEYFRDPSESDDENIFVDPPPNPIHNAHAQGHQIPVAEPEPPAPEQPQPDAQGPDEDMNANMDDDIDGALEAIGMRGPVTTVFQNAALMIFVLDTTIGVGVWLPFTIGKTSALLSLEPVRLLHLLHWPIRIIRIATDPLVDLLFSLLKRTALPIANRIVNAVASVVFFVISVVSRLPIPFLQNHSDLSEKVKTRISDFIDQRPLSVFSIAGSQGVTEGDSAFLAAFDKAAETPLGQILEPHFAELGRHVREHSVALKASWIELSYGDGSIHRVFAIALGYLVVGFIVALYLNILNVGNVQSAGRAIRSAIRQQLIVIKVAIFIVVELVVFPLGCGILLDACTLPLFPNASIGTRLAFFSHAPVTATFYDWMIGTMFMYQFAVILSDCRKIMRTGAMWFIKDPQDQNFHPIRDILDRPALVQLRKLVISAIMYSVVVACSAGGIVLGLKLWRPSLLPLRWNMRQPLSEIPIDLLFIHLALPVTLRYFRPRKLARKVANKYWRWAAHQLRLTSYMFGERRPTEELASTWGIRTALSFLPGFEEVSKAEPRWEGAFRRVPAADNIALPKEIRATVAVNEDGSPVDEASKRLMELQNSEADKAKRDVKEDYTIVYLPPYFKHRIMLFIASLWIVGSTAVVVVFAAPIVIGRAFFKLFSADVVHDAYSFVAGFYLLWGSIIVGKTLDRMDKRRQRTGGDEPRAEWSVYVFKQSIMWFGKSTWLLFWMGVVIPILIALVMEVYLIHPMKLIIYPDTTLRIRVVDQWAIGLIYTKIAMTSMRLRPQTRLNAAIKRFTDGGWRHPDALAATFEIIAPVTVGLITVILFPMILVAGLQHYVPSVISNKSLFLYVYPGIFVLACFARTAMLFETLLAGWAQSIRDSEFLLEMQLRNLEPAPAAEKTTTSSSDGSALALTPSSSSASPDDVEMIAHNVGAVAQ
ncbi:hypothetical protein SCHPADRAFT_925510 [Schizopora paradoxa]|uniref:RING-type E3 ubiquitin transferase n=1 Tax=Schizopora paradoxa TaxID=27342 RepID=A0A0H2S1Y2_9AGAM|nr:hypothetical protein SCHPADRAFT_925510 [Schizopora paradoxa]